jgi:hypothetical protein
MHAEGIDIIKMFTKHKDIKAHELTNTQKHKHKDIETQKHTNPQHFNMQTYKHTNIKTYKRGKIPEKGFTRSCIRMGIEPVSFYRLGNAQETVLFKCILYFLPNKSKIIYVMK